jgi:hypothetical protein
MTSTSVRPRHVRKSRIELWSTPPSDRQLACNRLNKDRAENIDHESQANDCTATPGALSIVLFKSEGTDCNGEDEKAISKEENRP